MKGSDLIKAGGIGLGCFGGIAGILNVKWEGSESLFFDKEVTGRWTIAQYEHMLKKAKEFFCHKVGISAALIDIDTSITAVDDTIHGSADVHHYKHLGEYKKKNIVKISKALTPERAMITLAHEIVHVHQFSSGRLGRSMRIGIDGARHFMFFDEKEYDPVPVRWKDRPWEREAAAASILLAYLWFTGPGQKWWDPNQPKAINANAFSLLSAEAAHFIMAMPTWDKMLAEEDARQYRFIGRENIDRWKDKWEPRLGVQYRSYPQQRAPRPMPRPRPEPEPAPAPKKRVKCRVKTGKKKRPCIRWKGHEGRHRGTKKK
jgi:hypothetical protein